MEPDARSLPTRCGLMQLPTRGGTRLWYEVRGEAPAAPVVVFLNAAFASLRHFDAAADLLASHGFRVVTFDHAGVGRSTTSELRCTTRALAADAVALLDILAPAEPVHVVGTSLGGCIAQHVALQLRATGRCRSLFVGFSTKGVYFRSLVAPASPNLWALLLRALVLPADSRLLIPKVWFFGTNRVFHLILMN